MFKIKGPKGQEQSEHWLVKQKLGVGPGSIEKSLFKQYPSVKLAIDADGTLEVDRQECVSLVMSRDLMR